MQFSTPALRLTFIHAESYRFPAPWVFGPARLPYSLLRLITAGSGVFTVDGTEHEVAEGDVVHLPEGSVLECRSMSQTFAFTSVRFSCPVLVGGQDPLTDLYAFATIMRPARLAEAAAHFGALADPVLAGAPGRHFLALGHLHLIRHARGRRAGGREGRRPGAQRARRVPTRRRALAVSAASRIGEGQAPPHLAQ